VTRSLITSIKSEYTPVHTITRGIFWPRPEYTQVYSLDGGILWPVSPVSKLDAGPNRYKWSTLQQDGTHSLTEKTWCATWSARTCSLLSQLNMSLYNSPDLNPVDYAIQDYPVDDIPSSKFRLSSRTETTDHRLMAETAPDRWSTRGSVYSVVVLLSG